MPLVKVKDKYQVTLPTAVRDEAGVAIGDILEAKVVNGKITLTPKSVIDRGIAEGLADFKKGRFIGPFDNADVAVKALRQAAKRSK